MISIEKLYKKVAAAKMVTSFEEILFPDQTNIVKQAEKHNVP